jgi:hypothetical protein
LVASSSVLPAIGAVSRAVMACSATAPVMALTMTSPAARASCRPVISKSGSVAEASRAPKMTSWPDFFQAAPCGVPEICVACELQR